MQEPDWPMPPMSPQRRMPRGGYGYGPYQGGPESMPYDEGSMEEAPPPAN